MNREISGLLLAISLCILIFLFDYVNHNNNFKKEFDFLKTRVSMLELKYK